MTFESVSNEAKLLLHILRLQTEIGEVSSQCSSVVDSNDFDSEKFVDLVIRNGLAGLVYLRIRDLGISSANIGDMLKYAYRKTALNNLMQLAELLKVLDIFQAQRARIVPLKGVVDAERLFGDLGAYPSNDIDLLVLEKELPAICEMLNRNGYCAIDEIDEEDLRVAHYHLIYRKDGACLEIHWNLVKRYFDIPSEFWWEGTAERSFNGRVLWELTPEKYLLYLIFRLFDHQFAPFKFWVHMSTVISCSEQLNWDKLLEYADSFGMKKLLCFTLLFANETLGTEVPSEISNERIRGYSALRKLVFDQNFGKNCKPHLNMLYFSCALLPPYASLKNLLARAFANKAEIRLRYGLSSDSNVVYLYMLLNPILMLFRKGS